jgi:GNAT superfamily N-acetyltransferase
VSMVLTMRRFQDTDLPRVIQLLTASLGMGPAGRRTQELFRWKHLDNPFGRSILLVAEVDERIIGLRAFMRWRFTVGGRSIRAVRAVDTATHPDFQGRGVFSELTRAALDEAMEQADLVFNTPNQKSLPGYLKMGWSVVGRVPILVRLRRPLSFVGRSLQPHPGPPPYPVLGDPATEVLSDRRAVTVLLEQIEESGDRLFTPRTGEYLRWRYGAAPLLGYRAVAIRTNGGLDGLCIFRVRPRGGTWETTVSELLVRTGDVSGAARLLRSVARASGSDHLTCAFPAGSTAARGSRRAGYLRAPRGITLVANPLLEGISPDPTQMRSWALSLGDLEVF